MGLVSLVLSGFKRVNNKTAPDLIGQDELTTLNDAVLDYNLYKPTKRGDFKKYDAGITAGGRILRLSDMKNSAGQQYIIAAVGDEVRIYNPSNNTWYDWITGLTSGFKFRLVPFSNQIIFAFDTNNPPQVGYTDDNFATFVNLELTTAGVTNIQSFHAKDGNLTLNTLYKWLIVGMTEDGQLTPPSRPFTHFYAANTERTTDNNTASTQIRFKNVGRIQDNKIKARMIFRTKADYNLLYESTGVYPKSGEIYYLHSILGNDLDDYETEFIDNKADDDLGTEIAIYLNVPTRAKYIAFSNERLFLGNFSQKDRNFISPPSSQTGGTPPTGFTDGVELTATDSTGTGGTLRFNTTYRYRIHYEDKYNRLSYFYHDISKLTSSNSEYNHSIQIRQIGGLDEEIIKECPRMVVFRQTAGVGNFYLVARGELSLGLNAEPGSTTFRIAKSGVFIEDFGVSNGTEVWVDPESPAYSGTHTGANGASVLTDSVQSWGVNDLVGGTVRNLTDGSQGTIISNTVTTVTATLTGGTQNDWDTGESYSITNINIKIKSYPSAICFSEISQPSTMRDEDKRQIFQDDGQPITGLFDDTDGLVVFKSDSIGKMFLSGNPNNWSVFKFVETIGGESETIQKLGGQFYFIYKNKAYRWTVGQKIPENIGIFNQYTLDTIVTWHDSTINEEWYVIQGYDGTSYITLVYDLKIDAWYTFIRQQNAAEVFKTIYFTKNGTTQELLSNCDNFVSIYNKLSPNSSSTRADTETGTTLQIAPDVKSKDFISPDGLTKARLRKLKFGYTKVTGQNTTIIIRDEDSGASITFSDTTGFGAKVYETAIGRDIDLIKKVRRFSVNVTGYGMEEWGNMRIETRPIKEGSASSA